jgi:hypothetical protein
VLYCYRNGQFGCQAGQPFGLDIHQGPQYRIPSPNPKVYLPVGNCLIGHIDGLDAMALTTASRLPRDKELPPSARSAGLTWQDAEGLLYDRDTLAFYGDSAWQARMTPGLLAWEQTLTEKDGEYRFEIRPLDGDLSQQPCCLSMAEPWEGVWLGGVHHQVHRPHANRRTRSR